MPATRRKSGNPTTASSQSTLSFNSKPTRVTKPSANDTSKKALSKLSEPAEAQVSISSTVEPDAPTPVDSEIKSSPIKAKPKPKPKKRSAEATGYDTSLAAAKAITDAQVKKYWKAEEDSRLAPRVHQKHVPLHEKILRHFDLSSQYGPCIGIPRLRRWQRAQTLGLDPPIEVLAVLLREADPKLSQGCGKAAYIDELAGATSRAAAVMDGGV